jgi:hypothetical protein
MNNNKLCFFTKEQYELLLHSGMFWELYPEATGDYEKDKELSRNNEFEIESDEEV